MSPALSAGTISETILSDGLQVAQSSDPVETAKAIAADEIDAKVESQVSSWLSNSEVSIQGVSKGKPTFSILTVQPFRESEDLRDTVFGQFSIFGNGGRAGIFIIWKP